MNERRPVVVTDQNSRHAVDLFAVIILFAGFVLVGISMVLFGSRIYQKVLASMEANGDIRTAEAYITQKVRQAQTTGAISVTSFDGRSALSLREDYGDEAYLTYLYENDGELCELFCAEDAALTAEAGSVILPLDSLSFEQVTDRAVSISLTTKAGAHQQFLLNTEP